jgi:Zn-dependent M28 family amino/carboxypeptidase
VLTGNTAPEQGFYFRTDHYEFARVGVPPLETAQGIDYFGKAAGFGETKTDRAAQEPGHPPWNSDAVWRRRP